MELSLSITGVEPFKDYITQMETIATYLQTKNNLTATEQMFLKSHNALVEQLEKEPNQAFVEPYLKLLKE